MHGCCFNRLPTRVPNRERDDIPYNALRSMQYYLLDDSLGSMLPADQTQMRESQPPIPTSGFPSRQSVLDSPPKCWLGHTIPQGSLHTGDIDIHRRSLGAATLSSVFLIYGIHG